MTKVIDTNTAKRTRGHDDIITDWSDTFCG